MTSVMDHATRQRALDVETSFIVQAPAGSGKTELLTQRYLALLGTVDRPEEVLAITFTRKAAGEMRDRILAALEAADDAMPESDHGASSWRLARAVRQRDQQKGWRLMDSPGRLRVMTIDAFHALLSRQLPILSGAGGALRVADQPRLLYREAARRTLSCASDDDESGAAARGLLSHLDNRFDRAETMLVSLLARRDQWLGRVTGPGGLDAEHRRRWLEGSIRRQIESGLSIALAVCPDPVQRDLPGLAAYAADNLEMQGVESPIRSCLGLSDWPRPDVGSMEAWRGLAELLLTGAGGLRKTVNKNQGFPPEGRNEKNAIIELFGSLEEHPGFLELLAEARELPDCSYEPAQWRILNDLLVLLPRCAAELEIVMREQGRGDYIAVADTARRALETDDGPTDLALALDYRIRHILVDEFQDTSAAQVELLRLLTAGWETGDGRTLFCVGDPMQSIYGFREAEVGLFLDVRRQGRINEVPIENLVLQVNFRSTPALVNWVNETFPHVMPAYEDARLGAVTFTGARAHIDPMPLEPVQFHAFEGDDGGGEAQKLCTVVQQIQRDDPGCSIAVLVRSRNHLERIVPELKAAGLRFQALEIERLVGRPVVQDLMALTRALSHPADSAAWLACLRAPWCGLTLDDLEVVAARGPEIVWDKLRTPALIGRVSEDGRARLQRFVQVVSSAMAEEGRRPLHRRVEGAWLALGGPATLATEAAVDDANSFLGRLRDLQSAAGLQDPAELEDSLADLFGAPDPLGDPDLQLMTIHKAKGLQFDYVLLPGLGRGTGADDPQLLRWMDFPRSDGSRDLLLAPIEERGADRDPLHRYISRQESKKTAYELARLLYVAVTRARRQVHFFGSLAFSEGETGRRVRTPRSGTLLNLLWQRCENEFITGIVHPDQQAADPARVVGDAAPCIYRLPLDWRLPALPDSVRCAGAMETAAAATESVEFWWAGRASRAVGTVVHDWLERLASEDLALWSEKRIREQKKTIVRMLSEEGLVPEEAREASDRVVRALLTTVTDEVGRWLLAGPHREARSEYAVAGLEGGEVVHAVIDRYIEDADGQIWVIDYKTGEHSGGDLEEFLDREVVRYRPQLARYGNLISGLQRTGDIRLGLYFPLHGVMRWWPFDSGQSAP